MREGGYYGGEGVAEGAGEGEASVFSGVLG